MTLINLKFSPEMESLIIQGKKICTTRDEQKGEIGDTFTVRDRLYRIVGIEYDELEYIEAWHLLEGFETPEQFVEMMMEFYPTLVSDDALYLHWFAYVGPVQGMVKQ